MHFRVAPMHWLAQHFIDEPQLQVPPQPSGTPQMCTRPASDAFLCVDARQTGFSYDVYSGDVPPPGGGDPRKRDDSSLERGEVSLLRRIIRVERR